jgi:hypothetical protein
LHDRSTTIIAQTRTDLDLQVPRAQFPDTWSRIFKDICIGADLVDVVHGRVTIDVSDNIHNSRGTEDQSFTGIERDNLLEEVRAFANTLVLFPLLDEGAGEMIL